MAKTRLTFVVGKGGVGKTTVSCAYALHLAAMRPRESILLMSTDPAHSLADVLETPLKSSPRSLSTKGKISAWQIDAEKEFGKFLAGNRGAILEIVESGTLFSKEEIAPLLDTTLPGMAEMAGLLAIQELLEAGEHDHIVVDTAPFGHTLRLFELPSHFQRFLNFLNVASSRDALLAEHFGGRVKPPAHAFLNRWERMIQQLREAFTARNATIFLVTSPESFSLNEAGRSLGALEESVPEMQVGTIILNRALKDGGKCSHCRARAQSTRKAEQFLKQKFPRILMLLGPDPGNPILGIDLLRKFGVAVFAKKAVKLEIRPPLFKALRSKGGSSARAYGSVEGGPLWNLNAPTKVGAFHQSSTKSRSGRGGLRFEKQQWPVAEVPLSFTVGKGGVGKTTTTAALAFHTRATHNKTPVTVCSTDPAPSLDDIFQASIGNQPVTVLGDQQFAAIEVDSVAEFRRWAAGIKKKLDSDLSMQSGGLHVDLTFEKQVFAALMDIVPPGVDEVFATFRIFDLVAEKRGRVFIDMAPTGHALELLRMPERIQLWSRLLLKSLSAHRTLALAQDVAVELASLGQQVRKLIATMNDPAQSRIWAVMLPEPIPDHQTARLLKAVKEIGITVDSLFVNRVLIPSKKDESCPRCRRAREWQMTILKGLRRKYRQYRIFVAPEMHSEIAGTAALKKFTSGLWQIAE